VFCTTALPWYVLCALRNPDFLRVFLWQHNFERYLTPVFEHRQPFWFFGYILLLAVIPWIWMLCALCSRIKLNKDHRVRALLGARLKFNSHSLLLGCWAVFTIVFFSLSQSKLPGYILPAIPPLFVLLGREVARSFEQGGKGSVWQTGAAGFVFLVFTAPLARPALETARVLHIANLRAIAAVLILTVAGGLCILALSLLKQPKAAFIGIVLLITVLVEIATVGILPQIDRLLSSRELAKTILSNGQSTPSVTAYKLPRAWNYGLNYYLGGEVREWTPASPRPDWIVTTPEAALEIQKSGVQIQEVNPISAPAIMLLHVLRPGEKQLLR
jgi:4-amino-4-deoxy-L-arabinose transferase-like glycosyltransferase